MYRLGRGEGDFGEDSPSFWVGTVGSQSSLVDYQKGGYVEN